MAIASSDLKMRILGSAAHGKPYWLDSLMIAFVNSSLTDNGDDLKCSIKNDY